MSAKPYLYHRRVAASEVAATVDALRDKLRYLYCESEAAIDLANYRAPDPNWLHGRAFGPELEVRGNGR